MSRIHSCSVLLAPRSMLSCGRATYSTLTSRDSSRVGSASTASPSHSRRVARVVSIAVLLRGRRRLLLRRTTGPGIDSLGEAGREECARGLVVREVEGGAVGGRRLVPAPETAQQIGADGGKVAVPGEPAVALQRVELVEGGL